MWERVCWQWKWKAKGEREDHVEDLKEKGIRIQHTEDRNKWKRLIRNGNFA